MWENLQKRSFQGPGWCILCKNVDESVFHLFLQCPYIKEVWKVSSKIFGTLCRWEGLTILGAWEN